jgi:hypothetical protein
MHNCLYSLRDLNAPRIESGELLWWPTDLPFKVFRLKLGPKGRLWGLWNPKGRTGLLPAGVGVRNCTSSLESTFSGSRGTCPAPLKADLMFSSVIAAWKAAWKAGKNSVLEIWVTGHWSEALFLDHIPFLEAEASEIKRLKQVGRMRRHKERYNIILLTVYLKVGRVGIFVPTEDQKTIETS